MSWSFQSEPKASAQVTVTTPVVVYPETVIYSQDFAITVDAWETFAGSGSVVSRSTAAGGGHSGSTGHLSVTAFATATAQAQRVFGGLTAGRSYTIRAWVLSNSGASTVPTSLFSSEGPAGSTVTVDGSTWVQLSHTFTASSSVATVYIAMTYSGAPRSLRVDDVTLTAKLVTSNVVSMPISEGNITMDSGWNPFVQSSVTVPMTSEELVEQIDPDDNPGQRVKLKASANGADDERTFDLVLRSREVSHDRKELKLELESDERLLQDYAQLTDDLVPRNYEGNLRSLVSYVITKAIPGATLQPGTANADLTATWNAENMILNPRVTTITDYTAFNSTVTYDTTFPGTQSGMGHNGVHIYNPTSGDSGMYISGDVGGMRLGMQAGKTYTFSASGSVRSLITGPVTDRQRRLVVHAWSAARGYTIWTSPAVPNTVMSGTNGTRVSVTFTVPPDATQVFIRAYHGGTGGAMTWGLFRLSETGPGTDADNSTYFWGSKPASGGYTYSWASTGDASLSKRVAAVERLPSLFTWSAGTSAWDFLRPLVAAAGLRLFCDEQRRWWLVDPSTYSQPGRFTAIPSITTRGTDTIDIEEKLHVDGVVCEYTWTDANGATQVRKDTAGTAGRVFYERIEREYPGPGRAAAIYARRNGQGRTQDVTVAADFTVTPGQEVAISLPGTNYQLGSLTRVTFGLSQGLMQLGSAGLRDTPAGAIDLLPGIIDALPGTIDSLS